MFVKNAYKILQGILFGRGYANNLVSYTGAATSPFLCAANSLSTSVGLQMLMGLPGDTQQALMPNLKVVHATTSFDAGGVIFGDGTTPVTVDDYKLSGNQITGISASANVTVNDDDITAVYTVVNNNPNAITISEIARIAKNGKYSGPAYSIMIDRELLKNPITIEPNAVGQVTYKLEYPIPTA